MIHDKIHSTKSETRKNKSRRLEYKTEDVEEETENQRTLSNTQKVTNKRPHQIATVMNKRYDIIKDKNARLER